MTGLVTTSVKDGVLTLRMNRPDKKNALTIDMYDDMAKAITAAHADDEVRAIVIAGVEGAFCAGNDIGDFLNNPPKDENSPVLKFLKAISEAELPLVAAVNGTAVGVGATMLLHCDFVYMSDDTKLSMPFVDLGLVPEAGASMLLPKLAGQQKAAELLMLGEPFTAQDAYDMGLVTRLCDGKDVEAVATATAEKLAKKPKNALRKTKSLLRRDFESVADRIDAEAQEFKQCLNSAEAKKAFMSFFLKRKPK